MVTYKPSREPKSLREAARFVWEDGTAEGKRRSAEKKAGRSEAQKVASERRAFGVTRVIAFFVGTGLFVATVLFVLTLGVPVWLVWAWTFVFWARWQIVTQQTAKRSREEWAERLVEDARQAKAEKAEAFAKSGF